MLAPGRVELNHVHYACNRVVPTFLQVERIFTSVDGERALVAEMPSFVPPFLSSGRVFFSTERGLVTSFFPFGSDASAAFDQIVLFPDDGSGFVSLGTGTLSGLDDGAAVV